MSAKLQYSVPALEKGLDILEVLSASPEPLGLTAVARALNKGNSEIFRMLNFLEQRRYVLRDAAGSYRLSLRLFQIAHAQSVVRQLVDVVLPSLRELSDETSESSHLSVLEGSDIVVLACVESAKPVRLAVDVGGRFSAIRTASGRMLLSGLPVSVQQQVLESSPEFRKMTAVKKKALNRAIAKAARTGFSSAQNETVHGVVDAAVQIGGVESGVHAAIAISSLHLSGKRLDPCKFLPALNKCVNKIHASLGYTKT